MINELEDVFLRRRIVVHFLRPEQVFDHILFQKVVRIIDDYPDAPRLFAQRRPELPAEEFVAQTAEECLRNRVIHIKNDLMIGFSRSWFHSRAGATIFKVGK